MIKYLGSLGTFIRLNDNENKTYQLLEIFSSSVANFSLFSAEVNNSTGAVSYNSASTSIYVNGISASVLPSEKWTHMTFSFNDKLATYDANNFLIRWGDTASSNFNIQNLYILESSLTDEEVSYIHKEFTGAGNNVISISDSASYSINITDYIEEGFISASAATTFQPLVYQTRYLTDIVAVEEQSLSDYLSASVLSNDQLYIDGTEIDTGNRILSLADNQIYEVTASSQLTLVSSSVGDFVRVFSGQSYADNFFLKTSSGFQLTPAREKVAVYANYFD